jgi:Flp pilus assembly pilin Flp
VGCAAPMPAAESIIAPTFSSPVISVSQVLDVETPPGFGRRSVCLGFLLVDSRPQPRYRGRSLLNVSALMHAVRRFLRSDDAIAVTEYGLLVALIAVLLIGVVALFGSSISSWFKAKTDAITTT